MKRRTIPALYFFPLFLTCTMAAAQTTLQLGPVIKQTMKENWADIEPIAHDDKGIYYLAIPYREVVSGPLLGADDNYHLLHVNAGAELVRKNVADVGVENKKTHYEFTREVNGKAMVFTSLENKSERTVSFYAHELDKQALQLTNQKMVVNLSFAHIKRQYERASFKSELSRDKSKLLISYSLVDDEGYLLTFGYVVLNSALKELAKWDGNLDMSDGVYLFDQFRLGNKGDVYLQTRYFQNEKAHDKNASMKKTNILSTTRSMEYQKNYEHRIVSFENKTARIIPVPNKERFYDALDFQVLPDGNLVLIGFYSTLEEGAMPIGAACLRLNVKSGAIQQSTKEFGNAFEMPSDISIKNNGLAAGKEQYLKYRFVLSDIHFNKNGGFTVIGERNVTQTKRNGNVFYRVYHLDDLAVVDVSSSGVVSAITRVEKSQQAESLQLFNASYYYGEYNGQRYLAFANMGKSASRESVLVTMGPDGKQSREVLFTTKEADVTIRPKECELYNGRLVMYGDKNRFVRWISKTL